MKENRELRAMARAQLKGNWLMAILVIVVYGVIISASGMVLVGPIILGGPLTLGAMGYFLKRARGESAQFESLFDGFKVFGNSLVLYLLVFLYTFLWSLLFFVPGIIKSFSYSMSFFILHDNPEMKPSDVITLSRKMMDGYKGKLFLLYLSFIGWGLLCCLSLGIGFLWLGPYIYQTMANFYEDLKQNYKG